MEQVQARAGERCERCGTPLEPAEVISAEGSNVEEIVLRCSNDHEVRVLRHHEQPVVDADDI